MMPISAAQYATSRIPPPPTDPGGRFWWDHFAPFVWAHLVASGRYSEDDIFSQLEILRDGVITCLCLPTMAQHAMKPASSPFELSWNFTPQGNTVRYLFQPLDNGKLLQYLKVWEKHNARVDTRWFRQFEAEWVLRPGHKDYRVDGSLHGPDSHPDEMYSVQVLMSNDLVGAEAQLKAYFLPNVLAHATGRSTEKMTLDMLRSLDPFGPELEPQVQQLEDFLQACPYRYHVEMVGIDCSDPARARIKVYVRITDASRAALKYFVTRGNRLDDELTRAAVRDLDACWHHFIDVPEGMPDDHDPPPKRPNSILRGIVCAATLSVATADGEVRIRPYCPVSGYQANDRTAVRNFEGVLHKLGLGAAVETFARGVDAAARIV